MLNFYWTKIVSWANRILPVLIREKNFLLVMGSLFLLGVVSKWIVAMNYGRLIRKAENMTNPRNVTLRQIKMKFDGIKQVNGYVANPMLLVKRHINRCKVGIFSINRLDNIINWCTILCIITSGLAGIWLYNKRYDNMVIMAYIGTGCFCAFALEMINRCVQIKERKVELAYVIVDFLENSVTERKNATDMMATLKDSNETVELDGNKNNQQYINEENKDIDEKIFRDEEILNQVIGEFLQ